MRLRRRGWSKSLPPKELAEPFPADEFYVGRKPFMILRIDGERADGDVSV